MSHNANKIGNEPLTEQTQLSLGSLLSSTPSGGDYLVAQSGEAWAPEPAASGSAEVTALGLTATAASSVADPAVYSNNTTARSYPFLIVAGQDLTTNGVTLLGSEAAFGPNWNTQFQIDQNGVWLIAAHMPINQLYLPTGGNFSTGMTSTMSGTASVTSTFGTNPLRWQKQPRKTMRIATVITVTNAPRSFRFYNFYATTAWQNVKPADVRTQYLEITRLE